MKSKPTSKVSVNPFKGLFILFILLLASGLLKESLISIPFTKISEPYTFSLKKPSQSEKHLVGLKDYERNMIKFMAKMIVKHVIRNA